VNERLDCVLLCSFQSPALIEPARSRKQYQTLRIQDWLAMGAYRVTLPHCVSLGHYAFGSCCRRQSSTKSLKKLKHEVDIGPPLMMERAD